MMRFKPHPEDSDSLKRLARIASDPNVVIPFIGEHDEQGRAEDRETAVIA
jgi:hypothetical protein